MRARLVILCSLVLMGVAPDATAAWAELRSPRYLFIADVSKGELRRIAERFEQFASVMERLLSRGSATLSTPTVVVVFKDERGARPFFPVYAGKPRVVAGMAMSGREINYILMNAESGEASYPIIFHELAHLITQNVTRNAAAWYSEGVAEYYSTFDLRSAKEAVLGLPIARDIGLLRERVVPLTELLAVDLSSPEYNESTKATLFYAQSWALVHMLRSRPSTRDRFSAYMRLSEQGLPQERAIAEGFGVPIAQLENELRQYARQFRMTAERWTFEEAVADADLVPRDLSEADAAPHLAALLAWQDRPEEAVTRLKSAAGAAPRSAFTHALLARLEADADRRKEALALLDRDLEYRGFLDHYAAAVVLSRLVRRDAPDELSARALELLDLRSRAAIEAQDNVAEAWARTAVRDDGTSGPGGRAARPGVADTRSRECPDGSGGRDLAAPRSRDTRLSTRRGWRVAGAGHVDGDRVPQHERCRGRPGRRSRPPVSGPELPADRVHHLPRRPVRRRRVRPATE